VFAYTDTTMTPTITTGNGLGIRSALPLKVREAFNASEKDAPAIVSGLHVAADNGGVFFLYSSAF